MNSLKLFIQSANNMSIFTTNLRTGFSTAKQFIFFFGAPGVGKGSLARLLEKDLGLLYLSTNQELRKIIKGTYKNGLEPSLVQKIRKVIKSGGLIGDDLVFELIREKAVLSEAGKGLILSGFPRNQSQLKGFREKYQISGAINITLKEDILLRKIEGRRHCVPCGISYNIENIKQEDYDLQFSLPKESGKCSSCNKQLSTREDDSLRVAKARLKQYHSRTKPVLTQLQKLGLLLNFQNKTGLKGYPKLLELVLSQFALRK